MTKIEKDSIFYSAKSKFEVTFKNGVKVLLITNWSNTFRIKWTHKITWWQKENSWIIKTAIVTLLGATTAYYFSYRAGYQAGLKEALKEGKQQDSLPILMGRPQSAVDTTHKLDTSFSVDNTDTTKHN